MRFGDGDGTRPHTLEPLLEERCPFGVDGCRDEHLPGNLEDGIGVDALEDGGQNLAVALVFSPIDDDPVSTNHPPVAHVEDGNRDLQRIGTQAEGVEAPTGVDDHLLTLGCLCNRGDAIPESRRFLVGELGSSVAHLVVQLFQHGFGVASEELLERAYVPVVDLMLDGPDARARALSNVEEQTGLLHLLMPRELGVGAGPDGIGLDHEIDRLAERSNVRIRAEVLDALSAFAAIGERPRPLLIQRDRQPGIRLVVFQANVEPWLVGLDQRMLEEKGVDLRGHHHPLDSICRSHHLGGADGEVPRVLEVVRQTLA